MPPNRSQPQPLTAGPLDQSLPGERGDTTASVADPTGAVRMSLKGLASLVAPGTLVTGLLYYFGWARASWQAQQMGLADSLLGYSVQDYLLQSLSAMFWPLMIGLLASVGGLSVHTALVSWATGRMADVETGPRCRRVLRGVIIALLVVVLGSLGLLLATAFDPVSSRFASLAAPLAALVLVVCMVYAGHLRRRFLRSARSLASPELTILRRLRGSVVATLVLLTLFWAVSHYAAVKGVDLALEVESHLERLPDVTLFSTRRLYLQPPVTETEMTAENDGGFRYAYRGLKFLFLADGRYFLRPSEPSASDRNIVIPQSETLRLELVGR